MTHKPSMIMPAIIGGIALGVTSAIPFVNCCCCLFAIGGGILAAYFYSRDYPSAFAPVPASEGVQLGLLTGLFGGIVWTLLDIPFSLFGLAFQRELLESGQMEEILGQIPFGNVLATQMAAATLTIGAFFLNLTIHILIAVIFALIGAIIGVAIFKQSPPPPGPIGSPGPGPDIRSPEIPTGGASRGESTGRPAGTGPETGSAPPPPEPTPREPVEPPPPPPAPGEDEREEDRDESERDRPG